MLFYYARLLSLSKQGLLSVRSEFFRSSKKKILRFVLLGSSLTKWMHQHRASVPRIRQCLGITTRSLKLSAAKSCADAIHQKLKSVGITCVFVEILKTSDAGKSLWHPFINNDIDAYNAVLRQYDSISLDLIVEKLGTRLYQLNSVHFTSRGREAIASASAAEVVKRLKCFKQTG